MKWKPSSMAEAEYLKFHDIMKSSINYTAGWTMMILLLKCII
jgi:hypothetical protein